MRTTNYKSATKGERLLDTSEEAEYLGIPPTASRCGDTGERVRHSSSSVGTASTPPPRSHSSTVNTWTTPTYTSMMTTPCS